MMPIPCTISLVKCKMLDLRWPAPRSFGFRAEQSIGLRWPALSPSRQMLLLCNP